jgi:(2Fe-2S) ferredoxin
MSKHGKTRNAKAPKVYLCRGCCCGTRKKHPGSDARLLERIARDGADRAGARYERTDCLGPCGQGNVMVVRAAGTYRWFRKMDGPAETAALADHLATHGDVEGFDPPGHRMGKRDGRKPKP